MLSHCSNPRLLISVNVLSDAFITSLFSAGIGFFVLTLPQLTVLEATRAVGIGIFGGTILSLALGRISDITSPTTILSIVQFLQITSYGLLPFVWNNHVLTLVILGTIFFLGRLVSPLRGALPPFYLEKHELLPFKGKLRSWTLSVSLCGVGIASLASLMDRFFPVLIVAVGTLCYTLCLSATFKLQPAHFPRKRPKEQPFNFSVLNQHEIQSWLWLLLCFSVIAISSALFPYIVANFDPKASWLLFASSLLGITVNIVFQRYFLQLPAFKRLLRRRMVFALCLLIATLSLFFVAASASQHFSYWLFCGVLLFSMLFTQIAQTLAAIVGWDVQYSAGEDSNRSLIVSIFALSSSLGVSVGQLAGGPLYDVLK